MVEFAAAVLAAAVVFPPQTQGVHIARSNSKDQVPGRTRRGDTPLAARLRTRRSRWLVFLSDRVTSNYPTAARRPPGPASTSALSRFQGEHPTMSQNIQ